MVMGSYSMLMGEFGERYLLQFEQQTKAIYYPQVSFNAFNKYCFHFSDDMVVEMKKPSSQQWFVNSEEKLNRQLARKKNHFFRAM